jgi:hypothetical protein
VGLFEHLKLREAPAPHATLPCYCRAKDAAAIRALMLR